MERETRLSEQAALSYLWFLVARNLVAVATPVSEGIRSRDCL